MSNLEVTFGGRLSRDELYQVVALHASLPMAVRVLLVAMFALLAIGFVGNIATAFLPALEAYGLRGPLHGWLLSVASAFVAYALAQAGLPLWRPRSQAKALARSGRANAEGVYLETDRSKVHMGWQAFIYQRRTADLVLLYTQQLLPEAFPRAFFASAADWQAFNRLVDLNVASAEAAHAPNPVRGAMVTAVVAFVVALALYCVV